MAGGTSPQEKSPEAPPGADDATTLIRDALRGLQFGSVIAIVQDGVVVQIERVEKRRLTRKR